MKNTVINMLLLGMIVALSGCGAKIKMVSGQFDSNANDLINGVSISDDRVSGKNAIRYATALNIAAQAQVTSARAELIKKCANNLAECNELPQANPISTGSYKVLIFNKSEHAFLSVGISTKNGMTIINRGAGSVFFVSTEKFAYAAYMPNSNMYKTNTKKIIRNEPKIPGPQGERYDMIINIH